MRIYTQSKSDRWRGTNAVKGVDTTEEHLTALCPSYCCGVPSSLLKPSNRHSCRGSRAGAPVCQGANPTVVVVIHVSRWRLHTSLCAVGQSVCCVCWHVAADASLPGTRTSKTASFLQNQITKCNSHLRDISIVRTTYGENTPTVRGRLKL